MVTNPTLLEVDLEGFGFENTSGVIFKTALGCLIRFDFLYYFQKYFFEKLWINNITVYLIENVLYNHGIILIMIVKYVL